VISASAFFDPARTFPTLPKLIQTDYIFFELLRLSNSRDSGDLRASMGRLLHKVSRISRAVPQKGVSGLWLRLKGRRIEQEKRENGLRARQWKGAEKVKSTD
jgi:hypothetical protein